MINPYVVFDKNVALKLIERGHYFHGIGDNMLNPDTKVYYFQYKHGIKQDVFDICEEYQKNKPEEKPTITILSKRLADKLIILGYNLIRKEKNKTRPDFDVFVFEHLDEIVEELEKWKGGEK